MAIDRPTAEEARAYAGEYREMVQRRAARPRSRYFAIYALCHLAAVGVVLLLFWGFVADHARSSPDGIAASLAGDFALGRYAKLLALSGFQPTPYTSEADAHRMLAAHAGACEARPVRGETDDLRRYKLFCGGEEVAALSIENTGQRSAFGNERWRAVSAEGLLQPYRYAVVAPEGVAVTVNGAPFEAQGEPQAVPGFENLPEGVKRPAMSRRAVEGLYGKPRITVPEGYILQEIDGHTALVTQAIPDEVAAALGEIAVGAAKKYASFITEDASFEELSALMLPGTPFYGQVKQFYNGWYITHDNNRFESVAVSHLALYGDAAFRCEVAFDYFIVMKGKTFHYPTSYTLFFVKSNGRYLLSDLRVD